MNLSCSTNSTERICNEFTAPVKVFIWLWRFICAHGKYSIIQFNRGLNWNFSLLSFTPATWLSTDLTKSNYIRGENLTLLTALLHISIQDSKRMNSVNTLKQIGLLNRFVYATKIRNVVIESIKPYIFKYIPSQQTCKYQDVYPLAFVICIFIFYFSVKEILESSQWRRNCGLLMETPLHKALMTMKKMENII